MGAFTFVKFPSNFVLSLLSFFHIPLTILNGNIKLASFQGFTKEKIMFHHVVSSIPLINQLPFIGGRTGSPFEKVHDLKGLKEIIMAPGFTLDKLKIWKKDLNKLVKEHKSSDQLDAFIKDIMAWGIPQNPKETTSLLAETLDMERLTKLAKDKAIEKGIRFTSAADLAKQVNEVFPAPVEPSFMDSVKAEWRRFRPLSLYLIPNVITVCMEFLNYFNSSRKYTSFWEKQLIIETVVKFLFLVPMLNLVLETSVKVYVVAFLILVGVEIVTTAYHRWFKPLPHEIVNCRNMDRQFEIGMFKPKVGQSELLGRIITALATDQKVLLVGLSGQGKTALINQLIQMKKEGLLPKKLAQLAYHSINCGDIMGHGTFGQAEMVNQSKEKIEGLESKMLFFFDDLDQFTIKAPDASSLENFKKLYLSEDENAPRVIAATTVEGYKKLLVLDKDGSFMHRMLPIVVESASDVQARLVVSELLERRAKNIPVTEEAIEKVLKLSEDQEYLPKIGRVAKVKKIMESAIAQCQACYQEGYTTEKLSVYRDRFKSLKMDVTFRWKKDYTKMRERQEVSGELQKEEEKVKKLKTQAQKIKALIQRKDIFEKQQFQLANTLNKHPEISEESQKLYLLCQFWGEEAFESILEKEMEALETLDGEKEMTLRINGDLIDKVHKQLKGEVKKLAEMAIV